MYNLIIFLIYKIQNHNLNMAQILALEEKKKIFWSSIPCFERANEHFLQNPQSSVQIVLKLENMLCTTDALRTAYDKIN